MLHYLGLNLGWGWGGENDRVMGHHLGAGRIKEDQKFCLDDLLLRLH